MVKEIVKIRSHRVAVVEVFPVVYNPKRNLIKYARNVEVILKFNHPNWEKTRFILNRYWSAPFDELLRSRVLNYSYFRQLNQLSLPIHYLIVTPRKWEKLLQEFSEWKERKGYFSTIAITEEIGSDASSIRNYIKEAYENWSLPPTYVLLVGDVKDIPCFKGRGRDFSATDLNFALVDGNDYFPDIYVARWSVRDETELNRIISKTIKYEKREWSGGKSWCRRAYFISSADGSSHTLAERCNRYCITLLRSYGMVCDSLWLYYQRGTPMSEAINEGRSFVVYSGHGEEFCWSESPYFCTGNIWRLTNIDKLPFVTTFACWTGRYTVEHSFTEAWIRVEAGGIAHLGSSVESQWSRDYVLQKALFNSLFKENITWLMGAINNAKLELYKYFGSSPQMRGYFEQYNLMGDGSIEVVWKEPEDLIVEHPEIIMKGAQELKIKVKKNNSPVEGALVGVKWDTILSNYTNQNGEVTFNIKVEEGDTLWITVTGHNMGTYEGRCVTIGEGGFLFTENYKINDSEGNGDGLLSPGEVIKLSLWVKNVGSSKVEGVVGILSTTNQFVQIIDKEEEFGDISPGESKYSGESGYKFLISKDAPEHGEDVGFELSLKDNKGKTWKVRFSFVIGIKEGVLYSDHDIGNVRFTITSNGACGFTRSRGAGSGFCYPKDGDNLLWIGSLWVGNAKDYVINCDYKDEGIGDWKVTNSPDGRVRMVSNSLCQYGWAMYNDKGSNNSKGLTVTQRSWAWKDSPYNEFVILEYTLKNEGTTNLYEVYVGQFMDFDIEEKDKVGAESGERLLYMYGNSSSTFAGVKLLYPLQVKNLTAIENKTYVYPENYILDENKIKFLNGEISVPTSSEGDWSIVVSCGPFDIEVNKEIVVAFTIIGGKSVDDLIEKGKKAQLLYDSLVGIEEEKITSITGVVKIFPNPFNKNVKIKLTPKVNERLIVKIYDICGRVVANLFAGKIGKNNLTLVWDGFSSSGELLPGGIYFCDIKCGKERVVKKLILIR